MRRPLTLKDHHHEQRIFSFRLLVSAILVTLLTVGLVGRMAWLQISSTAAIPRSAMKTGCRPRRCRRRAA